MAGKNLNQLFAGMRDSKTNYQPTGRSRGRPTHKDKIYPYWTDGYPTEIAAQKLGYPIEKVEHYYRELDSENNN
ncbi:hypothetical protein ACPV4Y_14270 [Vibrio harveyi]|uniref:hypothetical protein n=1 Tax=Vibrio harveyi TaxID=669 RepID=UPI0040696654